MTRRCDLAVIGGGAAGLTASITAARRGARAVLCERLPRPGRKILATGGGRCNLTNEALSPSAYTSTSRTLVASVLERFGGREIAEFFAGLGLETRSEDGKVYPATNQAASVLRVLEIEIARLGVALEPGFEAVDVRDEEGAFRVAAGDGREVLCRSLILAGGGKAYPALGSNGSCYRLAARYGHSTVTPVPSAVPLLSRDRMCHILQGVRIPAKAAAVLGGRVVETALGEVLFTQYGLSGTAVLDVSEGLSISLNRESRPAEAVDIDLVPFLPSKALASRFLKRLAAGWAAEDLAAGILPEKFGPVVAGIATGLPDEAESRAAALAAILKARRFAVYGTRGWNEAEFTAGGVDAREVRPGTLESRLRQGLYFAGEILDVQGPRGGFNLAWAWASGAVAARTE